MEWACDTDQNNSSCWMWQFWNSVILASTETAILKIFRCKDFLQMKP